MEARRGAMSMRGPATSGEEAFRPKPLGANVPVLNQTGTNGGHCDGIRSIENKNFPTARTKHKPRSNLEDGSNEKIKRLTLEDRKA
jgi:hypothetical protein